MSNSILDQIINNHKAEEVASLDAVEIISNLFNELNTREKDVISRRFGLHGKEKETLENIGQVHGLTRERIRQIENSAVKKLRQLENLNDFINILKSVINQLIEEHGGIIEHGYLLNNLVKISSGNLKREDEELHKNHLDFLIAKLLHDEFEHVGNSKQFKNVFKLKFQEIDHLEEVAAELLNKIKDLKKTLRTEELVKLSKELESYNKHIEKMNTPNNIDVSRVLGGELYEEDRDLINQNKIIYSILQASKYIEQNKFGHWGKNDWSEIKPKTINDKIFLVLKYNNKPMHFAEIADKINEVGFDSKKANAATVHNELILDNKYVLVGRGLYSLAEWGYKKGTVADIIIDILKMADKPLTRDEILEKVLEQRIVKKATIILALMDKEKFEKMEDSKYKTTNS